MLYFNILRGHSPILFAYTHTQLHCKNVQNLMNIYYYRLPYFEYFASILCVLLCAHGLQFQFQFQIYRTFT